MYTYTCVNIRACNEFFRYTRDTINSPVRLYAFNEFSRSPPIGGKTRPCCVKRRPNSLAPNPPPPPSASFASLRSTIDMGGLLSRSRSRCLVRSINFTFPGAKLPPGGGGGSRREFSREKRDRETPETNPLLRRRTVCEKGRAYPAVSSLSLLPTDTARFHVAAATRRLQSVSLPTDYNNVWFSCPFVMPGTARFSARIKRPGMPGRERERERREPLSMGLRLATDERARGTGEK